MRVRFLLAAVCLAGFAQFAAAAPPQFTHKPPVYTVTVTPGATVAYLYSAGKTLNKTGTLTDTDNDGKIAIDSGSLSTDGTFVVVDVATGEYASSQSSITPLQPFSVLPGPTGQFTELLYEWPRATALWVRPGVGMWAPAAHFLEDDDGSSTNLIVISSVRSFQPLGSSPPRPAAFERGDVLFLHEPDYYVHMNGGVLDPVVKEPDYTGAITFLEMQGSPMTVEGNDILFPVLRLYGTTGTVSTRFRTVETIGGAIPGVDYTPVDTIVTFGPGEMVKRVPVPTLNDSGWARPRSVGANLLEPQNTVLFSVRVRYQGIVDDEPVPVASLEAPSSVTETDAASSFTAAVTMTGARRNPITVDVSTSPSVGSNQPLVFQPGETRKEVVINVPGDDVPVGNRVFRVSLRVSETQQELTREVQVIEDDMNVLTIPPVTVQETVGKVTLKPVSVPFLPTATTFKWTTVDGSAKAGSDYVHASGTWKPNTNWEIQLVNDGAVEELETFYIDITDVTSVAAAATRIAVTIVDDDALPPPVWSDLRAVEGNGNTSRIVHATLSLPQALSYPLTYQVTSTPGTATAGTDYTRTPVSVTLQAGQTSAQVEVSIVGDDYPEEDETFTLHVAGTTSSAVYTIANDDSGSTPTLSAPAAVTVQETTGSDTRARFEVTLSAPAAHLITVDYETRAGTASYGLDFDFHRGTMFFTPGQTSKSFSLEVRGDAITEATEQFTVAFTNPTGVVLANPVVTITILDDDSPAPPAPKPGRGRSVRH